MKPASLAEPAPNRLERSDFPSWSLLAQDFGELTKVRVGLLIIFTTLAGMVLAARSQGVGLEPLRILGTLLGTGLVAGSAAALNQVLERRRDILMERTRRRPVAARRLSVSAAVATALALVVAGTALVASAGNTVAAGIALLTWALYVFAYTPLKAVTHFATVVGAVPGALPPLIGWTAQGAVLQGPAWILFGILFFWQLPHFLAIAWLYREDYARGGFPLLTVLDPSGTSAVRQALLNTVALIAVSLLPSYLGQAAPHYAVLALLLGVLFLGAVTWLAATRSDRAARCTVLASILYLPFLLVAVVTGCPAA